MLKMSGSDLYERDESHPVPDLGVVDISTTKKTGGADLFIVIAQPLQGDRRSLERLLRKIEVYLEFMNTEDFYREGGAPTAENTNIIVRIHPNSDRRAFDLLERNKRWVKNNNATLVIDASPLSSQ